MAMAVNMALMALTKVGMANLFIVRIVFVW